MPNGLPADPPVRLSEVKPDFESVLLQLQLAVQQRAESSEDGRGWTTVLTSGTGETLLELFGSGVTFNQMGIETSLREAFYKTARRESSIYAITNDLGVRISRKTPSFAKVQLFRNAHIESQRVYPRLTQFTVNGKTYFNRDPVVFEAGSPETRAILYQGVVKSQTFRGDGMGFRRIYLREPGFVVSDLDVLVRVKRDPSVNMMETWAVTDEGLWLADRNDLVFSDETDGDGDCVIGFGDNIHGAMPPLGSQIIITYVVTDGRDSNGLLTGSEVKMVSDPSVEGKTLDTTFGGANEKSAEYYRYMGPHIRKANRRAISDIDYAAILSQPSNIACAVAQGQSEIAPWDLRWMNQVRVCLLPVEPTQDTITSVEWDNVKAYMKRRKHAAVRLVRHDPTKLYADLQITLILKVDVDANKDIIAEAESAVRNVFARKHDTLGKRIAISDIFDAAKVEGVDYVFIDAHDDFICPDVTHYYELRNLVVSSRYSERSLYGERTRL